MFIGISNNILHLVIAVMLYHGGVASSYKTIFKEYFAFLVKTLRIYSDVAQDYTHYKSNIRKKQFFLPLSRRLLPFNVR